MTLPATLGRHYERTAENATSDGWGSNFSGAAFCLAQPIGGLLVVNVGQVHLYIRPISSYSANPIFIGHRLSTGMRKDLGYFIEIKLCVCQHTSNPLAT